MANSVLVIITKPPYGLEEAFAGFRMALAMGVNGMKTSVLLMGEGVYNAVGSQKSEVLRMPSNVDAAKELYDFEVPIYVVKEDLDSRAIRESRIFEGLKVLEASKVKSLAAEYDVVTTF